VRERCPLLRATIFAAQGSELATSAWPFDSMAGWLVAGWLVVGVATGTLRKTTPKPGQQAAQDTLRAITSRPGPIG